MIDGKDRVVVEWVDAMGRGRSKLFVDVVNIQIKENAFVLYVKDVKFPAIGVPLSRLVSYRALKDTEEVTDGQGASKDGESAEDSQVRDGGVA